MKLPLPNPSSRLNSLLPYLIGHVTETMTLKYAEQLETSDE